LSSELAEVEQLFTEAAREADTIANRLLEVESQLSQLTQEKQSFSHSKEELERDTQSLSTVFMEWMPHSSTKPVESKSFC